MKKRLLLVLVLGISFAPPVFGAEKAGQLTMRETFDTAASAVNCKSDLRAKVYPAESNIRRETREAVANSARQ